MTDDITAVLKNLDQRLHLVELHINRQWKKPPKGQRPRCRPKGSRSVPLPTLAPTLFVEHDLAPEDLVASNVLADWVRLSLSRRQHALLSGVVGDDRAWVPPVLLSRDPRGRAWVSLCQLRDHAKSCGELAALREVLRSAEHQPVDDVGLLKRGLALVAESLQLQLPGRDAA
jgi:hypothetical protein